MLMDSVGQEFGQGTLEMACLLFIMSGTSLGILKGLGLEPPLG